MAKEKEPIVPAASDDEEFFTEHGIKDDETKDAFRNRYLVDKYRDYRSKKEKPAEEVKPKKRFFD